MATNTDFIVKNGIVVTDSSTFGNTITGTDAVFTGSVTASNILDSAAVTSLIDSAYINARVNPFDSSHVIALVDSAYIQLRDRFQEDSNFVTAIVDSAYIQARQTTGSGGLDSAAIVPIIDSQVLDVLISGHVRTTSLGSSNRSTIIGKDAGKNVATGDDYNTLIGNNVGSSSNITDRNTMIGTNINTSSNNFAAVDTVMIGNTVDHQSGFSEKSVIIGNTATSATNNGVAIGYGATAPKFEGTAVGYLAGDATLGHEVAIGKQAGGGAGSGTGGYRSIAIGNGAYSGSNVTGNDNITIGTGSGNALTSGSYNTFIGTKSGTFQGSTRIYTGNYNILIGHNAGFDSTGNLIPISETGLLSFGDANIERLWIPGLGLDTKTSYSKDGYSLGWDSSNSKFRWIAPVSDGLDSANVTNLIDSAYIQARQTTGGGGTVDSAYVLSVVDSAAVPFSQTFYHFTADSGQITFSGFDDDSDTLAYTNGALAVYLNGILLVDSVDYTASNGTSIILTDSAAAGDVLSVLKFDGNTTGIDSANVINLIDSAYINARVNPFDSSHVLALVDSAYIQLRDRFQDSSGILAIVDSAYIESRRPAESIFDVVNNGSSAYTFTGDGFSSGRDNPTLYLTRGKTYKFNMDASEHPFQIRVSNGGSAYSTGVTNNGAQTGDIFFTPDMNAPTSLVYQCTVHSGMVGDIVILDDAIGFGKVYVSGQDVITADSQSSVLSFEAGQGITLQTDANTDTVTITNALNAEVARGIIDSAYVQARQTHYLDSALITQLIDSAYVTARAPAGGGGGGGGGVDSASTITLIEATVDSDYIGTKVDFTRGEFVNEKSQYTATASQTVFNHSSIDPTHLDVYLNGILQVVNDDYTATTSAVTFTAGVDSGYSVTIVEKRGRVATQRGLVESKYYFTTPTPTTSITGADDNSNTLDYSDGFLDVYLNGILLKDSDDYSTNAGTTVTLVSATDSNDLVTLINRKGVVVTPNVKNYEFTASAGQTTFSGADINGNTLAYVPGAAQVFLNGILLRNVDYTGITGTSIVLVDSASLNDELVVSAFSNPGQNMDLYKFTADSGQTIFSGNDLAGASLAYQPGNIQVFMNGLLLNDSDDYIASNGMSVVLTSGADLSDEIKIASFVSNTDVIRTNAWTAPSGTPVTAAAGDKLFIDTSSAKTVTLPSSASLGDEIRIIDVTGNAATNNITVARNGHNIQGAASDLTINVDRAGIGLVYYNVAQGWVLIEN